MAKLKIKDPINMKLEQLPIEQEDRGYLGISQLGHECDRYLYNALHSKPRDKVYPRTARIWERGNWEEDRITRDLKKAGYDVFDEQLELELFGGLVKGHIDGKVRLSPVEVALLEIKSMAESTWKKFVSSGIEKTNQQYYVQAQMYAYMCKLDTIIFAATNKNTEERFFEKITVNPKVYQWGESRAIDIISRSEPPEPISVAPDFWLCKMCSYNGECYGV